MLRLHSDSLAYSDCQLGFEENNLKNSSDQRFLLGFNLLSNNHFDRELLVRADYGLSWDMAENWTFDMQLAYSLANQNNSSTTSISRHLNWWDCTRSA